MQEFHVLGPPGTGKTTYLTRQIKAARERYDERGVMVVSFTRTAAAEIAARIDPEAGKRRRKDRTTAARVGTLHSICFHLLDQPKIADKMIAKWNEVAASSDQLCGAKDFEDPDWNGSGFGAGDDKMSMVQRMRATMTPFTAWPTEAQGFYRRWCKWKDDEGYMDFTDLIETCVTKKVPPPAGVRVAILDEAQDSTKLELTLMRQWAEHFDKLVIAYDDDQALFTWRGATPDSLIEAPISENQKRILSQSYRVPRVIHSFAMSWIEKISARVTKPYLPRDVEGSIETTSATFRHVQPLINEINTEIAAGRTFMVLAACSYMLNPIVSVLRDEGIPFHNPYRLTRGDWNPLRNAKGSLANRLWTFLSRNSTIHGDGAFLEVWTAKEVYAWAEHLSAAVFARRGAKSELKKLAKETPNDVIRDEEFFRPEHRSAIYNGDLDWYERNILPPKQRGFSYPIRIIRRDPKLITETPKVVVGTVHSVKGSESDVVSIWPDLSPNGFGHWCSSNGKDDVRRTFYVAFTRARERLLLGSPRSTAGVEWGV
ncbi:hypothetical protein LCGC14_0320230 [marine sediment metagenome]|uniref:DNA 3'-5' helicase n=1 Tax=marine sediment metagenome TaxID=412755 RepID=A0A0F9TJM7_9ZZZZ